MLTICLDAMLTRPNLCRIVLCRISMHERTMKACQWVFVLATVMVEMVCGVAKIKLVWLADHSDVDEVSAIVIEASNLFSMQIEPLNETWPSQTNSDDALIVIATKCISTPKFDSFRTLIIDVKGCPSSFIRSNNVLEIFRVQRNRRAPCLQQSLKRWLEMIKYSDDDLHAPFGDPSSPAEELTECAETMSFTPLDLKGKHLRFGSFVRPPFVTFSEGQFGGFCFEIVQVLQELYNFTFHVDSPSRTWGTGTTLPNGTWIGDIGRILRGELDMSVGPFSVTHNRQQVVDFTVSFYEESSAILIPPPSPGVDRLWACTKPFNLKVWATLLAFLCILPLIPAVRIYLCHPTDVEEGIEPTRKWIKHLVPPLLCHHFQYVFGILMMQSGRTVAYHRVQHDSLWRFLVAIWCLSAVVLIHAYMGTLMSILTIPKLRPAIQSLEDLPTSPFSWSVISGTSLESLFMNAESGIYRAIGDGLRRSPSKSFNNSDLVQGVINRTSVYINGRSILEYFIEKDYLEHDHQCRMSVAKHEFFRVSSAFALPKESPLSFVFNRKILQMIDSGLADYWRRKHWPSISGQCSNNHDLTSKNQPRPMALGDLQSAFYVLIMGYSLGLLAFVAEFFRRTE